MWRTVRWLACALVLVVLVFVIAWVFLDYTWVGTYVTYRWADQYSRARAAATLLSNPKWGPSVVGSFESDSSAEVRRQVVVRLVRAYPEHLDAAIRVLRNDPDPFVRQRCAGAMRYAGANGLPAIPALIEALDHRSLEVAETAMWSLTELTGVSFDSKAELEGVIYTLPFLCRDDWERWWATNKDKLVWDEEASQFVVTNDKP